MLASVLPHRTQLGAIVVATTAITAAVTASIRSSQQREIELPSSSQWPQLEGTAADAARNPRSASLGEGAKGDRDVLDTCRVFSRARGDHNFFPSVLAPTGCKKKSAYRASKHLVFELGQKSFGACNLQWFLPQNWTSKQDLSLVWKEISMAREPLTFLT